VRQHRDDVAERMIGQIGHGVARRTERDEVRDEPSYRFPTLRPGPTGQSAQPTHELVEVGISGDLRRVGHRGEANCHDRAQRVLSGGRH